VTRDPENGLGDGGIRVVDLVGTQNGAVAVVLAEPLRCSSCGVENSTFELPADTQNSRVDPPTSRPQGKGRPYPGG
jgi:hypothetical protein